MVTDPSKLSKALGSAAGTPINLTTANEEGFDRLVQRTVDGLEAAKTKIEEAPLLHRLKVFHLDDCELNLKALKENPTHESLDRATRTLLSLETVFMLNDVATIDMVTGLPNRKALTKELEIAIADLQRGELGSAAIAFVDLNKFKPINDQLGHEEGDNALHLVGQEMEGILRKNDIVSRIGGDEFVILFRHHDKNHDFKQDIRRLQELLQKGVMYEAQNGPHKGRVYPIGGAIGVEILTAESTPNAALKSADLKMYEAKHGGAEPPEPAGHG